MGSAVSSSLLHRSSGPSFCHGPWASEQGVLSNMGVGQRTSRWDGVGGYLPLLKAA